MLQCLRMRMLGCYSESLPLTQGLDHGPNGAHVQMQRAGQGAHLHDLGHKAHVCDGAPLDGQAGQAQVPPRLAQRVDRAVGVPVVCLACSRLSARTRD